MKYRLHKEYVWTIIGFAIPSLFFGTLLKLNPTSVLLWGISITCLFPILYGIVKLWKYRKTKTIDYKSEDFNNITAEFTNEKISFPNGYYFRCSSISNSLELPKTDIEEIIPFSNPPSVLTIRDEIIFIPYSNQKDLLDFSKSNNIQSSSRTDIWELICQPYLDTSFTSQEKKLRSHKLKKNNISADRLKKITKKVRWTLYQNYLAEEWDYLGQFDYLKWNYPLSADDYWWSMKIATANNNKKEYNKA